MQCHCFLHGGRRPRQADEIAENTAVALGLASNHLYDLVIMDMQMPVLDGFDSARALREMPGYGGVPSLR